MQRAFMLLPFCRFMVISMQACELLVWKYTAMGAISIQSLYCPKARGAGSRDISYKGFQCDNVLSQEE